MGIIRFKNHPIIKEFNGLKNFLDPEKHPYPDEELMILKDLLKLFDLRVMKLPLI